MRLKPLQFTLAASLLAGCAAMSAYQRDEQDLKVAATPERVARGEYLTKHVMACIGCHTAGLNLPSDDPIVPFAGGAHWGHAMGFPGEVYSANLTSDPETGLGRWTDGQILGAIRDGRAKDGSALFPIMPYGKYHQMSDDDAYAIVAYLRSLPPVKHPIPARSLDFPLNLVVGFCPPSPLSAPVPPAPEHGVAHGEYLSRMAACADCHTGPLGGNAPFSGGFFLAVAGEGPDGKGIPAPNITSDRETGIGAWTDDQVKAAIRLGLRPDGKVLRKPMPWPQYNGMSDADLDDLVAYLRTVPAVHKVIDRRW